METPEKQSNNVKNSQNGDEQDEDSEMEDEEEEEEPEPSTSDEENEEKEMKKNEEKIRQMKKNTLYKLYCKVDENRVSKLDL